MFFSQKRFTLALFTLTMFAYAGFAQDKTQPAPDLSEPQILGTHYDEGGFTNSLINLKTRPPQGRTAVSPAFGEVDPVFNPVLDAAPGQVRASAVQSDGKILVAGYFRTLNGARYNSIVRLNADLSIDPTFNANVNGTIMAIAVQADGKIIIGGAFTAVSGVGENRIARLLPSGGVDTTFDTGGGTDNLVYDIAVQADGKIMICGTFNGVGLSARFRAARLLPDGTVDPSFSVFLPGSSPTPGNQALSLAVQPDGKVLLAGLFVYDGGGFPQVTAVVRLNTDGALDSSFNAGTINTNAWKVALQPDGKVILAGGFNTIAGVARGNIARLNSNGSLDNSLDPGIGTGGLNPIFSLALQPDGTIFICGFFSSFNGAPRGGAALLKGDGSLDSNFAPPVPTGGILYSILPLPSAMVLVGGSAPTIAGAPRDTLALLSTNGSVDTSFTMNSTARGGVRVVIALPDGKMLMGGLFTRVGGILRGRLVRLNADGSFDPTFNSASFSSAQINALVIQPDGKILVGGSSMSTGPSTSFSLIRLNPNGSVDTSFTQGGPNTRAARAIAVQPDGKILLAYQTVTFSTNPSAGLARFNPDGSVDSSFTAPPLQFEALVVLPDGKILAGGPTYIGYINSTTGQSDFYYGILRLNSDGAHDTTFRAGFVSNTGGAGLTSVYALERQPDGRILAGGTLYTGSSSSPIGMARLNPTGTIDGTFQLNVINSPYEYPRIEDFQTLPNGKIVVGGLFSNIGGWSYNNIARLDQNGVFDQSFAADTDGPVFDVAMQPNGKIIVGGDFETVDGAPRTGLARLFSEPVVRHIPFDFDGDGKSDVSVFRPADGNWYILQSTAGYTGVHFGIAADKLAPADYDGDGKTDIAVFRDGAWYLQQSTAGFLAYNFGQAGDIPQPADFNGDGKAELAVFRPSDGGWYKLDLNGYVFTAVSFGQNGDKPVVGDYDGDGKADPAVFRSGSWYILASTQGYYGVSFGIATDKPVQADYDGDGKTDQAVVRDGFWYLLRSSAGYTGFQWGNSTDLPVAADYDGDGKADVSVFRDGFWYLQQTAAGYTGVSFGSTADKPVPNSFVQ
jgi:uncharacterized delta-60 repeat protein